MVSKVSSVTRICIIDPVFTRYRLPIFEDLSQRCQVDWIFSPSPLESGFGETRASINPRLRYVEIQTLKPLGWKAGMFQLGLAKYIVREKPDAIKIFANPRYLSFWTTLLVARLRGIPCYAHGVALFKKRRISPVRRLMMKAILRLTTSYIAYAPVVRESLADQGFLVKKVFVAHNSLINPFPVRPEEKSGIRAWNSIYWQVKARK